MSEHRKVSLKIVPAPTIGHAVSAPPILKASDHTIDYSCRKCGTVLMYAERGLIR